MHGVSIIDAPSDLGLRRTGVDALPEVLRTAGLLEGLPDVRYAGRLSVPAYDPLPDPATGVLNAAGIAGFAERLAERVGFTLELGRLPLILGGDCSILLGPALALRRRGRYGLFFIDGHADFYSPETEPAGEAASMDLAFVTGHGPDSLVNLGGHAPLVREEDAVVFGIRDAASASAHRSPDVRTTRMKVFDLAEVRAGGPGTTARKALTMLELNELDGFWIHLDADVLHDEIMPAVDYRMPDGLWADELTAALAVLLASPLLTGMDITIYNPTFDDDGRSAARVLAAAVTRAFAQAS